MAKERPSKKAAQGPGPRKKRLAMLHPECVEDLRAWTEEDRRIASRVLELMTECLREPFTGKGKPEPLKGPLAGAWSRRITQEHRLVYIVHDDRVEFVQARYHY
jgi:toxin YoeB